MNHTEAMKFLIKMVLREDPDEFWNKHVCIVRNPSRASAADPERMYLDDRAPGSRIVFFVRAGSTIDESSFEPLMYRSVFVAIVAPNRAEPESALDIRVLKSRYSQPCDYVISEKKSFTITQI